MNLEILRVYDVWMCVWRTFQICWKHLNDFRSSDLPVPQIFGTKLPPIFQVTRPLQIYKGNWKIRKGKRKRTHPLFFLPRGSPIFGETKLVRNDDDETSVVFLLVVSTRPWSTRRSGASVTWSTWCDRRNWPVAPKVPPWVTWRLKRAKFCCPFFCQGKIPERLKPYLNDKLVEVLIEYIEPFGFLSINGGFTFVCCLKKH